MRKEHEMKLQNEFPFMKVDNPRASFNFDGHDYVATIDKMTDIDCVNDYNNDYANYGCAHGDGWYEVLRGLCTDIVNAYEEQGLEIDLKPQQIKEKFGTLRFYYRLESTGEEPLNIDFLGSGRLTLGRGKSDIGKAVADIVSKWEKMSAETCENCGAPGVLRKDLSWIRTLCDDCYEEISGKKEKQYVPTWQWELDDDGLLTITGTGSISKAPPTRKSGKYRFENAFGDKAQLIKSVIVQDGITSIGEDLFMGCENLTSVKLPESVTYIGSYVFRNCRSLKSVNIPSNVTIICGSTFRDCTSLDNIHIPDGIIIIGKYAFAGCTALVNINLPDSVKYIENNAFLSCAALTQIKLPKNLIGFGANVFKGCLNLKDLSIDESHRRYIIRDGALFHKIGILLRYLENTDSDSYTIPDGTIKIGRAAFYKCENLKSISIPDNITSIANYTFWGCKNLINIRIPDGVVTIRNGMFHSCESLPDIVIPDSVTCIEGWAFAHCNGLTSVIIPDSVSEIGPHAFDSCANLSSVTVPDGVTYLSCVFEDCTNLTVTCSEGSYVHEYAQKNGISVKCYDI